MVFIDALPYPPGPNSARCSQRLRVILTIAVFEVLLATPTTGLPSLWRTRVLILRTLPGPRRTSHARMAPKSVWRFGIAVTPPTRVASVNLRKHRSAGAIAAGAQLPCNSFVFGVVESWWLSAQSIRAGQPRSWTQPRPSTSPSAQASTSFATRWRKLPRWIQTWNLGPSE